MKKIYSFLAILLLFTTSCDNDEENEPFPITEKQSIKIEGVLTVPDNIPSSVIGQLEVFSGFYGSEIPESDMLGGRTKEDTSVTCELVTFLDAVQVHSVLNDGKPLFHSVSVDVREGQSVPIDAESTAISLIFMHKTLITTHPPTANRVIDKIRQSPTFPTLVEEVAQIQRRGHINSMSPSIDRSDLPSYNYVLVEALGQLTENFFIEQDGLEVINVDEANNEMSFQIKNYRKRYLSVYAETKKDGALTPSQISQDGTGLWTDSEFVTSGSFSWIEGLTTFSDQITQESPVFKVKIDGADMVYVNCYGLGFAENSFPNLSAEDFRKGTPAIAMTSVFDFGLPLFSLVTGLNGLPSSSDLRGRPNSDPLKKLLQGWTTEISTNTGFHTDLFNASANDDFSSIMKGVLNFTASYIGSEENTKLMYDLIKQRFKLDGNFSKNILGKSLSALGSVIKVSSLAEDGVNLAESIYAVGYSKWKTEFRIKVNGYEPPIPTEGLVAYYPFNGNAKDESGNGNDGTVNGNTAFTDGVFGSSISLGSSPLSNFEIPNSALYNLTDFSISLWVNINQFNTTGDRPFNTIISAASTSHDNHFLFLYSRNSLDFRTYFINAQVIPNRNTDYNIKPNQWSNLVIVRKGGNCSIYLNSVEILNYRPPFYILKPDRVILGQDLDCVTGCIEDNQSLKGKIDQLRIYNQALSPTEILALYNEQK